MNCLKVYCVLAAAMAALASGCGDNSPSSPTPSTAQVAGVWNLTSTVTSVSGGECFGPPFQTLVGQRGAGTAQIQQTGASLTATVTDDSTGGSCSHSGTAGASSLALNTTSCTASDALGARCPGSGLVRNIRLQTGGINATVSGSTMTGTSAETYKRDHLDRSRSRRTHHQFLVHRYQEITTR